MQAVFASYMLVFAFGLVLDGNCYIMSFPRILGFLVIIPLRHRVHSPRYPILHIFCTFSNSNLSESRSLVLTELSRHSCSIFILFMRYFDL
jgi:hypothetical protein